MQGCPTAEQIDEAAQKMKHDADMYKALMDLYWEGQSPVFFISLLMSSGFVRTLQQASSCVGQTILELD